jgi:hypothetical protein
MASEKDLELLDEYLTNRLQGNAKAEFEEKLLKDPDLQSELGFQQQIAAGLRKARAAELKAILKNIPITPTMTQGSNYMKWTGAATVIAIGVGLFLYLHKSENTTTVPITTEQTKVTAPIVSKTEPLLDSTKDAQPGPEANTKSEIVTRAKEKKASSETTQPKVTEPQKLEVFDPSSETETDVNTKIPHTDEPIEEGSVAGARTVLVDNDNRKYKFHYQINGDTLTLFGDFQKNLYTIMEFNSDDKERVVFMYYKNSYYLLNQSPGQINRLVPVNDPVLLKRLREQRITN